MSRDSPGEMLPKVVFSSVVRMTFAPEALDAKSRACWLLVLAQLACISMILPRACSMGVPVSSSKGSHTWRPSSFPSRLRPGTADKLVSRWLLQKRTSWIKAVKGVPVAAPLAHPLPIVIRLLGRLNPGRETEVIPALTVFT